MGLLPSHRGLAKQYQVTLSSLSWWLWTHRLQDWDSVRFFTTTSAALPPWGDAVVFLIKVRNGLHFHPTSWMLVKYKPQKHYTWWTPSIVPSTENTVFKLSFQIESINAMSPRHQIRKPPCVYSDWLVLDFCHFPCAPLHKDTDAEMLPRICAPKLRSPLACTSPLNNSDVFIRAAPVLCYTPPWFCFCKVFLFWAQGFRAFCVRGVCLRLYSHRHLPWIKNNTKGVIGGASCFMYRRDNEMQSE